MTGAQAEPYYGMDRYDKKSSGKDVSVKSIKCNNVNVNVNGLDLNLTSVPFLSGLLASEADEGKRDASYYGSDGSYGDKSRSDGDFKFVCINNNNNTVVVPPPVPPVDECFEAEEIEACFEEFLFEGDFLTLVAALESGITVEINGEEVTLGSFADICLVLESATTYDEIISILLTILNEVTPGAILPNEVIDCIAGDLGIPIPPIET